MSKLRSAADYGREIAELELMAKDARILSESYGDFATRLRAQGIEERLHALRAELAELSDEQMTAHELDVVFNGKPVIGNMLEVDFMGKILTKLQGLISAMTLPQKKDGGHPSPATRKTLKAASKFHFVGSFPGSFGMKLEAFQEQPTLDGFSPLSPTLDSLLSLLEAGDQQDPLLEQLAELNQSAIQRYTELVTELDRSHAQVRIVWPTTKGGRHASLRPSQVSRIVETLKEVTEDSDGHFYTGELDQASQRYGRFGFKSETGEVFDGVVEPGILDTLPKFYAKKCRAYILTQTVLHRTTQTVKRSHRLLELEDYDRDTSPYR